MKKYFKKMLYYIKTVYRISLNYKKYENIIWNDLKNLFKDSDWRHGVFENEKRIEAYFEISDKIKGVFHYMLFGGQYHCRVKVIESFPIELTTDVFVLAAHFNNLLNSGVVVVDVQDRYVEYHTKSDYIVSLIYPGELHDLMLRHYRTAKDMFWAFQKMVTENEEPSIIIADVMRMIEKEKEEKNTEKK
jgi:hypothetical protein